MTTKREQARKLLAPIFLPEVLPAILDAMEIMGQPAPDERRTVRIENPTAEDVMAAFGMHPEPTPEPEEPLDTRVCWALGKHDKYQLPNHDSVCYGPDGNPWKNQCFPWSTSELGVGAMINWINERTGHAVYAGWKGPHRGGAGVTLNSYTRFNGDTPQAALANAVVAVGGES